MALFMINICTFDGCGQTFQRLHELIHHIELQHINRIPVVTEQKEAAPPKSIALSYVHRYASEATILEYASKVAAIQQAAIPEPSPSSASNNTSTEKKTLPKPCYKKPGHAQLKRFKSSVFMDKRLEFGSEFEEEALSPSEDSNDSWTAAEEYSSDYIMRYGSRMNGPAPGEYGAPERPFECPVPGCPKRYKNVNGIKYHAKNGHKKDGKQKKAYRCPCGKRYKTEWAFMRHTAALHPTDKPQPTDEPAAADGVDAGPPTVQGVVVTSHPLAFVGGTLSRFEDQLPTYIIPTFRSTSKLRAVRASPRTRHAQVAQRTASARLSR